MKTHLSINCEINFNSKNENLSNSTHDTIQLFLMKFKKVSCTNNFSFCFKSNPNVFSFESNVPDLWLKTRKPFDKKNCFFTENENTGDTIKEENLFPKIPYIIPDESSLNSKIVHLTTIGVNDLFSNANTSNTDNKLSNEFNPIKETVVNNNYINSCYGKTNDIKSTEEQSEENRKWFLIFPNNINYGPYITEEIFIFLKSLFFSNIIQKEIHSFMVCDSEQDIYFQPQAALEVLENIIKDRPNLSNLVERNREMDNLHYNSNLRERKFENSHLVSKYDVFEMNSKFKTVQYLPIKQLKEQLKEIRNNNANNRSNIEKRPNELFSCRNSHKKSIDSYNFNFNKHNKINILDNHKNDSFKFSSKTPKNLLANKFNIFSYKFSNDNNSNKKFEKRNINIETEFNKIGIL